MGPGTTPELLTPTVQNRLERGPLPNIEQAGALGTTELVGGDREEVHTEVLDIDLGGAEGLHRIAMDQDVGLVLFDGRGDSRNVLDHSGLVVEVHHRDDCSVGVHRVDE